MTLEELVKERVDYYKRIKDEEWISDEGLSTLENLEDLLSRADTLPAQSERRQTAIQIMASMVQSNNLQSLQYLARRSVLAADEILKALEDEIND